MVYRIIYSLDFALQPRRTDPPRLSRVLSVPLNMEGQASSGRTVPRPPKQRIIDLRVGDQLLCNGRWETIIGITAARENWLTEEDAAKRHDAYVYALPNEMRSVEELRLGRIESAKHI